MRKSRFIKMWLNENELVQLRIEITCHIDEATFTIDDGNCLTMFLS